jgi:hypothetical protein
MKRAVSAFTRPPGQKPDALALMGWLGGWIVLPEATKLSVSMIVNFSAFLPHCKLSDLTDSLSAPAMIESFAGREEPLAEQLLLLIDE